VRRIWIAVALNIIIVCQLAAAASATPPPNDDYLAAKPLGTGQGGVSDTVVTTDATTQADVFSGRGSGGGPEPLSCHGAQIGKTVWYTFTPPRRGVAEVRVRGFDAVAAVYQYDPASAQLGRLVDCADTPGSAEDLFARVEADAPYAVQVGGSDHGAGADSGTLQVAFDFFADADRDDVFDELDQCPTLPGPSDRGGCPPRIRASPVLRWLTMARGVRVVDLRVTGVPAGSKVALRCVRRCSARQTTSAHGTSVKLTRLSRRPLADGAQFEVRITHAVSSDPAYAFGTIGDYFRFEVRHGDVRRIRRCLLPDSPVPHRTC
jgi:hypothetical protein